MSDGSVSDHRIDASPCSRSAVQVFNRRKCGGYQHHCNLLYLFFAGGAIFLQGCGEPQVYMGNAGGCGVFSDYLCGLCRGRPGICANQQHLYHDAFDLSGQWYAGRNDGVAPTGFTDTGTKNFVKKLSFLSEYVILAKER